MGFGKLKEHSVPSAGKVISDLLQVLTIALVQLKGPHIIFLFLDCSLFSIQEKPHKQASVLPSVTPPFPLGVTLLESCGCDHWSGSSRRTRAATAHLERSYPPARKPSSPFDLIDLGRKGPVGDTCHQVCRPEFNSWDIHDGRREPTLASCPLTPNACLSNSPQPPEIMKWNKLEI